MATSKNALKKLAPQDQPYIDNYPPLRAWLDKHDARCLSQVLDGTDYIERYAVNGRVVVVVVRAKKSGWSLYTEADTAKIDETLADAEKRLGISP